MIRSSFVAKGLGLGLLILGSLACGDKPQPKPPENVPAVTDGGDTTAPTTTDTHADAGSTTATTDTTPPPAAPAGLALPTAAGKLKVKVKKDYDIEVKSDGTVNSGGKAVAKITGMELQDPAGKPQLKVDGDGNITTADGGAYGKFEGDDLTSGTAKWSIGDDGAVNSVDDKGKKTSVGKAEGVGNAKKSALLSAAFVIWGMKSPGAGKPAAPAKPAAEPKKPDTKKPADKPAPKK